MPTASLGRLGVSRSIEGQGLGAELLLAAEYTSSFSVPITLHRAPASLANRAV